MVGAFKVDGRETRAKEHESRDHRRRREHGTKTSVRVCLSVSLTPRTECTKVNLVSGRDSQQGKSFCQGST